MKLFKITAKSNQTTNKVKLTKGMSVEISTSSGKPNANHLEKIAQMFENKYGTLCTKGYIGLNDFIIEEI